LLECRGPQEVDITAPLDRVYSFVADRPEAATSFIPGLNSISNVSPPKRVPLEVEYDIPQNMLARYASKGTLEKINQDRAAEALSTLKGLLEE
jgi:carbon monoxide dehydrogenase subunit G